MVQFRKSMKLGPVRVTASKRGISTSVGAGPVRVGLGADGKVRRTLSVPGTGIYDTKVVGGGQRQAQPEEHAQAGQLQWPAPEGPPVNRWQRSLVKIKLRKNGVRAPSLDDLTIGQAVSIIAQLGDHPAALWQQGRAWGAAGRATKEWRKQQRG